MEGLRVMHVKLKAGMRLNTVIQVLSPGKYLNDLAREIRTFVTLIFLLMCFMSLNLSTFGPKITPNLSEQLMAWWGSQQ